MNDQQAQLINGETGTQDAGHGTGSANPDMSAPSAPATAAAAAEVEAPRVAPEQEESAPKADAPKVEASKAEAAQVEPPKVEPPKTEAPKTEAPKVDAVKPEAVPFPGKVMIMSPGDRVGADAKPAAASAEGPSGKRRVAAMAAVVALATVAGALGGALATAGLGKMMAVDSARRRRRTARSKPRWRGSMPISSR